MATGGRSCPYCRAYNARSETHCIRCGKWLPPAALAGLLREPMITELWATKALALISIVVFALQIATAGPGALGLLRGMPLSAVFRFGALTNGLEWAEPFRLLAACFVHFGVLHIGMNLLAFADLGRLVEKELGGSRLVIAYVVTGIIGFVASALWYGSDPYATAGASGAVFGIDGVIIGVFVARKDARWKDMLVRTVVYSFLFFFAVGTNQAAHLGGLASGVLLGVVFWRERRPWKYANVVHAAAALGLLASVASIGLSAASPLWREFAREEQLKKDSPR